MRLDETMHIVLRNTYLSDLCFIEEMQNYITNKNAFASETIRSRQGNRTHKSIYKINCGIACTAFAFLLFCIIPMYEFIKRYTHFLIKV